MNQFQPGEYVYVRIVFQHGVPIKNAYVVFVHKEDENEHVVFGFKAAAEEEPLAPDPGRVLDLAVLIEKDKKPGVYVLDKINFESFSGNTLNYQGDIKLQSFEVMPEHDGAPVVEDVSLFSRLQ